MKDAEPNCFYCGGTGNHHGALCFCRMTTPETQPAAAPRDIRTGEPLFSAETWARMSDEERAISAYQNSPHKQRVGEMYRRERNGSDAA